MVTAAAANQKPESSSGHACLQPARHELAEAERLVESVEDRTWILVDTAVAPQEF
jgi:hypothetical protein